MMAYQMIVYLAAYLLLTSIIYWICPQSKRYIVLLFTSILAYSIYNKAAALFMLVTILTTHFAAILIEKQGKKYVLSDYEKSERKKIKALIKKKKRLVVFAYCVINLGILFVLKYFNFFAATGVSLLSKLGADVTSPVIKILLPLGISYYTLQALGYVIDVYRGKYPAEKEILKTALFVSFFPQLYEGPFGRYDELMPQLCAGTPITSEKLYSGLLKLLWGAFKVFMVANRAAILSDEIFSNYEKYSGIVVFGAVIMFTIQLYAEFSGYIDMARGISEVFSVNLAENFDMPFFSQNVAQFWRKWHISLGSWFRDYIFYPVSTSKTLTHTVGKLKNSALAGNITIFVSLFVVWFLTGLWHGASAKYIVYGLYYYVLMILFNLLNPPVEKLLSKCKISDENSVVKAIRIVKTLFLVLIGMLIFRAENLTVFSSMFLSLFKPVSVLPDIQKILSYKDLILLALSLAVIILSGVLKMKGITPKLLSKYNSLSSYIKYWICFGVLCVIIIFGAYGLGYAPANPIYGGF